MARRLSTLTRAERLVYDETVRGPHSRHLEVVMRRRDGKGKPRTLGPLLDWQVDGDLDRVPVEVATLTVLDEDRDLAWHHGRHRHYKVQLVDSRFIPDLDDWVEDAVFTGPLWDFDRAGPAVRLICEGSEMEALGSLREEFHRPAKTKSTSCMKALLTLAGAKRRDLRIPNRKARLPRSVTVGVRRGKKHHRRKKGPKVQVLRLDREHTYLDPVLEIAESLAGDFFTDGHGRFTLAAPRSRPTLFVTEDMLLEPVGEKPVLAGEDAPNTWLVVGANPKGPRGRVHAEVGLPRRHPLSAAQMAYGDEPRQVTVRIENDKIRTHKQARAVGVRHRDRAVREVVTYTAAIVPAVPWWRPGAMVSLPLGGGVRVTARPRQWTHSRDGLTLGANRRKGWHR